MGIGFHTSLSGMSAGQRGLNVTQQNIANINTKGYARQRMDLSENMASTGSGVGQKIGSGVKIDDIKIITDQILMDNYNNQQAMHGYYSDIQQVLDEIETVFGDYTIGNLNEMLNGYFEAWEEISKFPEESSYKFALLGETQKLTQKLNGMGGELARIKLASIEKTQMQIDEVNEISRKIATTNRKIIESGRDVPNALLNERNRLIEEISSFVDVDVSFESGNQNIVSVRVQGTYIVDKEDSYDIRLIETPDEYFLTNGTEKIEMPFGSLTGNIEVVNSYIPKYEERLETLVQKLMTEVNTLHSTGFSINGDTGIDFFTGANSRSIAVNSVLLNDVSKIATSGVNGVEGNTDTAKNIANVINVEVATGLDFQQFTDGFRIEMAQELNTVNSQVRIHDEVLSAMLEQKEEIQGVNLEEEMTNMMMYQKYFSANAKAINTMKELYDTLLQML